MQYYENHKTDMKSLLFYWQLHPPPPQPPPPHPIPFFNPNLINWNWDDVIVISSDDEDEEEEETSQPINLGRKRVYGLVDQIHCHEE